MPAALAAVRCLHRPALVIDSRRMPSSGPVRFPETRWSLIGRLRSAATAPAPFLELYASAIDRYLRLRLAGEADASDLDDVIQDVLVHLIENPALLAEARPGAGSRFRYYLMTVAHNAARNALRRRRRERARDGSDDPALLSASLGPEQHQLMDRAWAESVVREAWGEIAAWAEEGVIDAEVPAILDASLIQGRTLRDIAAARGLSLATCQRRLARGRMLLQRAITERLRAAGEVDANDDSGAAGGRLLDLLRSG